MNNPKIAVLILGYDDKKYLDGVMRSVLAQSYDNYVVFYIDNASQDDSVEYVRNNYSEVRVLSNKKNLGYALAYKLILREIFKGEFSAAVLLNSDVVVSDNWLAEMIKTAYDDEKTAFVQPKIFLLGQNGEKTEQLNTSGNKINYLGFGFCGEYKKKSLEEEDREIAYASGACILVKKEPYLNIGELDEDFFAYLEDQDLGWRAKMLGYRNKLSAKSTMWHAYKYSATARNPRKFFLLERNRAYFILKNYSFRLIVFLSPIILLFEIGVLAHSLRQGYFWQKIRSYFSLLIALRKTYIKRKHIQSRRTISDKKLWSFFSPMIEFSEIGSEKERAILNVCLKKYYKWTGKLI